MRGRALHSESANSDPEKSMSDCMRVGTQESRLWKKGYRMGLMFVGWMTPNKNQYNVPVYVRDQTSTLACCILNKKGGTVESCEMPHP